MVYIVFYAPQVLSAEKIEYLCKRCILQTMDSLLHMKVDEIFLDRARSMDRMSYACCGVANSQMLVGRLIKLVCGKQSIIKRFAALLYYETLDECIDDDDLWDKIELKKEAVRAHLLAQDYWLALGGVAIYVLTGYDDV